MVQDKAPANEIKDLVTAFVENWIRGSSLIASEMEQDIVTFMVDEMKYDLETDYYDLDQEDKQFVQIIKKLILDDSSVIVQELPEIKEMGLGDPLFGTQEWVYHKDISKEQVIKYAIEYSDRLRKEDEINDAEDFGYSDPNWYMNT
jgi:hypothetical protein